MKEEKTYRKRRYGTTEEFAGLGATCLFYIVVETRARLRARAPPYDAYTHIHNITKQYSNYTSCFNFYGLSLTLWFFFSHVIEDKRI